VIAFSVAGPSPVDRMRWSVPSSVGGLGNASSVESATGEERPSISAPPHERRMSDV
jgi:hypothetical protein